MNDNETQALLRTILENVARRVEEDREFLTELDSQIGDADFGSNLHRGCQAALEAVADINDPTPNEFIRAVGETLIDEMAGSSGIIFGMSLVNASEVIKDEITPETIVEFVEAYRDTVADRGSVNVGAKTMYDVVVPVADTLHGTQEMSESDPDPLQMSANAVEAARRGAQFTSTLRAKRGRASYTEWRSVGHPDPGAVGSYIILQEIHRTLESYYDEERSHDYPNNRLKSLNK